MYPILRTFMALWAGRQRPKIDITDTTVTHHRVWPWDGDVFMELNHGRTLTLFELGRWPHVFQMDILGLLRRERVAFAIAGVSVRYRRRLPILSRFRMVSRVAGWDDRFIYYDQSMWQGTECANQALIRVALRSPKGTIAPDDFLRAMGRDIPRPALPEWIKAWIDADATRPWPPEDAG